MSKFDEMSEEEKAYWNSEEGKARVNSAAGFGIRGYECSNEHIAIIYGSQPCPLCASHRIIDNVRELASKWREDKTDRHQRTLLTLEQCAKELKEVLKDEANDLQKTVWSRNKEIERLREKIVELWHATGDQHVGSLWEVLGMTWEEYGEWAAHGADRGKP